ncbi:hypothetical protein T492DRAFT_1044169 [Pavlovales sp. CCMP2436]|nr:hypothetical protein T492DRAFT_1044169 [Pavlovales sp. CCMP2436]
MVEGHGVHRVARALTGRLVGRKLKASSPNGRFSDGASAIDGKRFARVEAIGKNLFAFFGEGQGDIVVHVHFGMAGVWAIFDTANGEEASAPTGTTRLRLEDDGVVSHLSAMTVVQGDMELYAAKRKALGQDPLRTDADAEALWLKVSASKKSIGQLLMDQSVFCGPGNIYRAEILFCARVHPEHPGNQLLRPQLDLVWQETVRLMRDGFQSGSIKTVSTAEAAAVGKPELRRWIYNRSTCGRCDGPVLSWEMSARTCYACPSCQPRDTVVPAPKGAHPSTVFNSHCARDSVSVRIAQGGCGALTVAELKGLLKERGASTSGNKRELAARLEVLHAAEPAAEAKPAEPAAGPELGQAGSSKAFIDARSAAAEKARAGENRAVEHVAELAPEQARRAALASVGPALAKRKRSAQQPSVEELGASDLSVTFPQRKSRSADTK